MRFILMLVAMLLAGIVGDFISRGFVSALLAGAVVYLLFEVNTLRRRGGELESSATQTPSPADSLLFEVNILRRRVDKLESAAAQAPSQAEEASPSQKLDAAEPRRQAGYTASPPAPEPPKPAAQPKLEEWMEDDVESVAAPFGLDAPLKVLEKVAIDAPLKVLEQQSAKPATPPSPKASEPAKPAEPVKVVETAKTYAPAKPPEPPQPSAIEKLVWSAFAAAKNWLLGGNTAVRIGLLVLFMGLAWLLKYASERYAPPVELRYIGVAIAALVLLALGWRLRLKKPPFALMLQGGGIAILYLTTFSAVRLHALLPSEWAFAVMVSLTAAAVALAIMQDAMGLACAAVLGGFASPILISTGGSHHVALFSYFALLNTGIALIAWFKAWRVLNLIGFAGTFSIVGAFSVMGKLGIMRDFAPNEILRYYTPDKFASTEPFLILFLLMFVLIGLLFARRKLMAQPEQNGKFSISPWSETNTDYLDGTLAFGPPLVGFGLQCLVISHIEFGMAFSALALGLFYLVLAFFLRGRPAIRMMVQVYLALGIVFATLAIPLAFNAQWTSAAWALEGAGVYWVGRMQRRRLAKAFSLTLILVASFLYLKDVSFNFGAHEPLLVGSPMGAALLGVAFLACFFARRLTAKDAADKREQLMNSALAAAGLAFLYLMAPLVFGRNGVVIAWALAGMATVFAGMWLTSRIFTICALAIETIGGVLFLSGLEFNSSGQYEPIFVGYPLATALLGAALLGVAFLAGFFVRRLAAKDAADKPERATDSLLATVGLAFLYLMAPLVFGRDGVVIAWALAGMATVFAGMRLTSRIFISCAFAIQAIGGLLFLSGLEIGQGVLLSGWNGVLRTVLIGAALTISALLVRSNAQQDETPPGALAIPVWAGLFFINLAFLFVLDWGQVGMAWAASGLLILWLGLWRRIHALFYFGIVLEIAAGFSFLSNHLARFVPSNGWATAVLAVAALAGAWRLHRAAVHSDSGQQQPRTFIDPLQAGVLSNLLLIWGVGWWLWCVADRVMFYCFTN